MQHRLAACVGVLQAHDDHSMVYHTLDMQDSASLACALQYLVLSKCHVKQQEYGGEGQQP